MSQIHKKCLMASAGTHLLLLLILLVGPAFLMSRQEVEDMPVLEFIPDKLIDEPFSGGGNPQAQPPPPVQLQAPPAQTRPQPKPETRAPEPQQTKPEAKPEPKDTTPRYTPSDKIKVNLKPVESSSKPKPAPPQPDMRREFSSATSTLRRNFSPSTSVETPGPGGGGPAYANYAQAIKTLYERAWEPPQDSARDDAIVKVRVVILRDGTIRSARVIDACGDSLIDGSVEAALRRVTRAPAFPEGSKDSERTFVIGFNLRARLSG
jgi:TonB family protein